MCGLFFHQKIDLRQQAQKLIQIIEENGGYISLDQILVRLYRKTGDVHTRAALTRRVYKLVQNKVLVAVSGKKGVYSTKLDLEIEEEGLFEEGEE